MVDEPVPSRRRLVGLIGTLRVGHTVDGPARHQPITLLWALGRAARHLPRLVAWRDAQTELRGLLREYGQPSSKPTPEYPVLALPRPDLWELQGHLGPVPPAHGNPAPWLDEQNPRVGFVTWVYELAASDASARAEVVQAVGGRFFGGSVPEALLAEVGLRQARRASPTQASPLEEYLRLCSTVEAAEARGDHDRTTRSTREEPVRSAASVQAVLIRSGGRCENPLCAGQPDDVTKDGDPILEVDHVHDRGQWGRDHPIQMVALCPNCHAVKTRGRTGERLRGILLSEARERHAVWVAQA